MGHLANILVFSEITNPEPENTDKYIMTGNIVNKFACGESEIPMRLINNINETLFGQASRGLRGSEAVLDC